MQKLDIPNENKHLIKKHLEAVFYNFNGALDLCNEGLS